MKFEFSAGGIIYRKRGKQIEILLLKDKNDQWTFPKGLIEKGEDKVKTARREIEEEVGLKNIDCKDKIDTIQYFYRFDGELVKKIVYYYLFLFTGKEKPSGQKEEEIKDVNWFTAKEALNIIGYKDTNKKLLSKAIEKIDQNQTNL